MEKVGYSRSRRFRNSVANYFKNPYNILVLISAVLLIALVIFPLLEMIATTFKVASSDVRRIKGSYEGAFTMYYWKKLFASNISYNMLYKPLMNSLMIAMTVSILSLAIGGSIAWLMVRSDIPGKRFFSLTVIIPFMIPSWCKSIAWSAVFKNARVGGTRGFLSYLGFEPPDWLAYGPVAIILVLTIHYYAYAYILSSAAMKSINSELEEMGECLGASKFMMLRKITFPLVLPSLLSSFILIFSKAMGTFGVPAFLGLKVGYYTISTMLYTNIKQSNTAMAYTISLVLIVIAALVIFINQRLIGTRKSYATINGKGGRANLISLKGARIPVLIVFCTFLFVGVFLPIIILFVQSLMLKLGDYGLGNLTLHYWIGEGDPDIYYGTPGVFRNPFFYKVLFNSLRLGFVATFFATILGQFLGYIISRGRSLKSGRLIEQLVFIPYLIPSIAFGAMYLSMFSVERCIYVFGFKITLFPVLYGTTILLVLVSVVKNLPLSSRSGSANMLQINKELEEAAMMENAGFLYRMRTIIFPLSKNGFMSSFLLIFMAIMKELDLLIILISPATQTLPYLTYYYESGGMEQFANVSAIIMFLIVFIVYWVANKFFDADLAKGM